MFLKNLFPPIPLELIENVSTRLDSRIISDTDLCLSGWFDRNHTRQQHGIKRREKLFLKQHTLVKDNDRTALTETVMETERLWMTI